MDFFRGRLSWRKFLALLDRLPAASHYWEAVAGDEEIAEAQAGVKPGRGRSGPKLSDFNPVVAELAVVSDLVGSVLSVLTRGQFKPEPRPRPVTALERVEERQRVARLRALEDEVSVAQERWQRLRE